MSVRVEPGAVSAYDYLMGRNYRLVKLLDKNASVSAFINSFCHGLVNLCEEKGIRFEDVEVGNAIIRNDGSKIVADLKW